MHILGEWSRVESDDGLRKRGEDDVVVDVRREPTAGRRRK